MNKTVSITVLPEDREKGDAERKKQNAMLRPRTCSVAQALMRELGTPQVTCGSFDVSIGDDIYVLPNEVTRFIHAEDDEDAGPRFPLPFTFTMTREASGE